jgi:hypothetical protein
MMIYLVDMSNLSRDVKEKQMRLRLYPEGIPDTHHRGVHDVVHGAVHIAGVIIIIIIAIAIAIAIAINVDHIVKVTEIEIEIETDVVERRMVDQVK